MVNINIIHRNELTETRVHTFTGFASDLGLPVTLPTVVQTDTPLGNGRAFHMVSDNGNVALYRQELGCVELRIFND